MAELDNIRNMGRAIINALPDSGNYFETIDCLTRLLAATLVVAYDGDLSKIHDAKIATTDALDGYVDIARCRMEKERV